MFRTAFLAALALVFALALPATAKPNEARDVYRSVQVATGGGDEKASARPIGKQKQHVRAVTPRASKLLAIAARDLGRNPSGWSRLWCARQLNLWLKQAGMRGTGSNLAKSFLGLGTRVSLAQAGPGDIVITGRRGGGHVLILEKKSAVTVTGISGNSGGRGPGRRVVARGSYPVSRILGIVRVS